MAIVGTAYVVYRGLTQTLEKDLQDGIKRAGNSPAVQSAFDQLGSDLAEAVGEKAADETSEQLADGLSSSETERRMRDAGGKAGGAFGSSAGDAASGELHDRLDDDIDVDVRVNVDRSDLDRVGRAISESVSVNAASAVVDAIVSNLTSGSTLARMRAAGESMGEAIGQGAGGTAAEGIQAQVAQAVASGVGDADQSDAAAVGTAIGRRIGENAANSSRDSFNRNSRGGGFDIQFNTSAAGREMERDLERVAKGIAGVGFELGESMGSAFASGLVPRVSAAFEAVSTGLTGLATKIGPGIAAVAVVIWQAVAAIGPALGGAILSAIPIMVGGLAGVVAGIGGIFAAIKAGGPEMSRFTESLRGVGEDFRAVGQEVGRHILPQLSSALRGIATTYIPVIRSALQSLQPAFDSVLSSLSATLQSSGVSQAIERITVSGGSMVAAIGRGISVAMRGVITVVDVARPLMERFGTWVETGLGAFTRKVEAMARSGELQRLFDKAAEGAKALWDFLVGVSKALAPIFDPRNLSPALKMFGDIVQGLAYVFQFMMFQARLLWTVLDATTKPLQLLIQSVQWLADFLGGSSQGAFAGAAAEMGGFQSAVEGANGAASSAIGSISGLTGALSSQLGPLAAATEAWDQYGSKFDELEDKKDQLADVNDRIKEALAQGGPDSPEAKRVADLRRQLAEGGGGDGAGAAAARRDLANARRDLAEAKKAKREAFTVGELAAARAAEREANRRIRAAKDRVSEAGKGDSKRRSDLQRQLAEAEAELAEARKRAGDTRENDSLLRDRAGLIQTVTAEMRRQGGSVDEVSEKYRKLYDSLLLQATGFKGSKEEAQEYIDKLLETPEEVRTQMIIDTKIKIGVEAPGVYESMDEDQQKEAYLKWVRAGSKPRKTGGGGGFLFDDTSLVLNPAFGPGPGRPVIGAIYVEKLAAGGVVSPAGGGTLALLAEAGRPERVTPLDSDGLSAGERQLLDALSGFGSGSRNVTVNNYYPEPERASDSVAMSLRLARWV